MTSMRKNGAYYLRLSLTTLLCIHIASPLIISPPSSASDYRQLASLLVETFDAPPDSQWVSSDNEQPSSEIKSKMDAMKWYMFEKSLTVESTYKQYASTARRMRGKKYCLLVAKEFTSDADDNQMRVSDEVIGMVEMGMSICPVTLQHKIDTSSSDADDTTINDCIGLRPQPTVGVLCVNPSHQQKGIGHALVQKCEEIAADIWGEQMIFVDVEPDNQNALLFFEKCGYDYTVDETGEFQMRNTTVSRRRMAESKPHLLLRKKLKRKI